MKLKKYLYILIAINLFILSFNTSIAHANIASKPLTITAKKVAKDLAKDTAVEMANQIVSEYLVRELIEGINTDSNYTAVCMDGAKANIKDCAPEKRAQIKNLTSSDKKALENKVETVLERKTHTSSKWTKFLDWFIPIFLIAGTVEFISSAILDGDILSFFDEIAQEALIESQFLKPLLAQYDLDIEILDFAKHVLTADFAIAREDSFDVQYRMNVVLKPNTSFTYSHVWNSYGEIRQQKVTTGFSHELRVSKSFVGVGAYENARYYASVKIGNTHMFDGTYYGSNGSSLELYRGTTGHKTTNEATAEAKSWIVSNIGSKFMGVNDINAAINAYINTVNINPSIQWKFSDITTTKPPPPQVDTVYGTQTAIEKIKDENGNHKLKGISSFTYVYNNTYIYPSPDSTTGWKDTTTGEDIQVNEDEILVDETTTPTDPDEEEGENENACTDKIKLPSFKPIGQAFTTSFPFSIPWDIKRAIDSAFGGVGDTKPSFNLSMFGDGVVLTVPDFIDNWMPFLRGFLVLGFDLSILFLFYRFMKGGE